MGRVIHLKGKPCKYLGVVCFFKGKTFVVCRPPLQSSVAEELDQTSTVCKKKSVCFLTSTSL
ncbi:hypothetical protein Hanom_Chr03g00269031 [Helianthus anomalus]